MIPVEQSARFLSGVRAIGFEPEQFVLSRRNVPGALFVFVGRGAVERRYPPENWVDEALRELRAGVYGKR